MDAPLRRELRAIAADRLSGASQLASQTCRAVLQWHRRAPRIRQAELRAVGRAVLRVQPAMAPIARIAFECFRASQDRDPKTLAVRLRSLLATVESGPAAIARRFKLSLRAGRRSVLLTHSYSGTVVRALAAARSRIGRVVCSEGRPNYEGRHMARELASAGIRVELTTDSALTEFVALASAVVVGADAVSERGIRNKVGTAALAYCALQRGVPVWVLADTSKLLPRALCGVRDGSARNDGSPEEVWPRHPAGIRVLNPYFAWTRFRPGIHILTETGWTTPRALRKLITRLDLPKSWPRGFD